MAIKKILLL